MKVFLVFTLTEISFTTRSCLEIINYILKMSRYTNIVCIGRYLVLTYTERFIAIVCCFLSYICWSVNCISWVSKFHNSFLTCTEIETSLYFRTLIISFMESSFPTLRNFFHFFYLVHKLFSQFSAHLSVSKLYQLSFWIIEPVLEISSSLSINLY